MQCFDTVEWVTGKELPCRNLVSPIAERLFLGRTTWTWLNPE